MMSSEEMELMVDNRQLPVGWEIKTLGESCEFYNGKAHENHIDDNGSFIVVNSKFISSDGAKAKKTCHNLFPLYKNDIVMVMSDVPKGKALAKCYLIEEDNKYSLNQRICVIRSNKFDTKFLYYHLNRHPYLLSFDNGGNQTNLRKDDILKCPLYVPPLPEQKRIVAIADEAFEGIDRAIRNTEKNLSNARELFESYLNSIFTQKGDGWEEKTLQDILIVQPRNGWSPPANNHSDVGTPVLTLSSVTGFQFNKTKVKFTNAATKKDAHYWLKNGELLITRSNTTELVGHVAICKGLSEPIICCDLIMKMQINPEKANTKFIYWHFRTHKLRELITSSAQGANPTMKKINKSIVQNLPVFFPDLSTQKAIVKKIDELSFETQRLETIYRQKIAALKELKQSILQKAFTGELTADKGEK